MSVDLWSLSGHRFPRSGRSAAAAAGGSLAALRDAGSGESRHGAGRLALVGRAHLPQRRAGRSHHQQRLQLHAPAPRVSGLPQPRQPRRLSGCGHRRLHQPRRLRAGHRRTEVPRQSQALPLQLALHSAEAAQGRRGAQQLPEQVKTSSVCVLHRSRSVCGVIVCVRNRWTDTVRFWQLLESIIDFRLTK